MRVEFSITNQRQTPSIHAAALANRPIAGQPGRLFIDTDNPSTGIYRDTGSIWIQIALVGAVGNLQTVTDAGNTSNNHILLTYADQTTENALIFYNNALAKEEYLIEKRGTGITTNDSLVIQSRENISGTTKPVGFLIDGANEIVRSFYEQSFTGGGIKLDFAAQVYEIGDYSGINDGTTISASSTSRTIVLTAGSNYNSTTIEIDDIAQVIRTTYQGGEDGLRLNFVDKTYLLGGNFSNNYFGIDTANSKLLAGADLLSNSSGGNSGQHLKINIGGTDYKIKLENP